MSNNIIHPFKPVYDKNSKVLILGSFPSVKSRETDFYYGHPQNRFWKVISAITNAKLPETNDEKKLLLLTNKIALWDVLQSCNIKGSSDLSIKYETANNLDEIINFAEISLIILNGAAAYKFYIQYHKSRYNIKYINLPSTSSANAKFQLEDLILKWEIIKKYLK